MEGASKNIPQREQFGVKTKEELKAIREHTIKGQEGNLELLSEEIKVFRGNMFEQSPDYSSLRNQFSSIKNKIDIVGDQEFKTTIQDSLNVLEEELKNESNLTKAINAAEHLNFLFRYKGEIL